MRFLEYQGEKFPLKLGYYALKHFQRETKKNLLEIEKELEMEDIETLFYHAYVNGCLAGKSEGWKVKYSREEAEMMLDDNFFEFSQMIPELLEDSLNKKKSNPVKEKKKASKK